MLEVKLLDWHYLKKYLLSVAYFKSNKQALTTFADEKTEW